MIKKVLLIFACGFLLVLWLATWQLQGPFWLPAWYSVLSFISFLVYGWDKRLAVKHGKDVIRVPERSLHILALIGGWPGALIAQQWLRHKSQKRSFIIVLWLTVFANCAVIAACYYYFPTEPLFQ